MDESEVARAVDAVRAAVGASEGAESSWRVVTRLDPGRADYVLVGISTDDQGWVAAVSLKAEIQTLAVDPAGAHAWWTGITDDLVWAPGTSSRSMLYPLRRVITSDDTQFLDHHGQPVPLSPRAPG